MATKEKMIRRAKVTLKGCRSYKLNGKKWKKDMADIVKGNKIDDFKNNGFFHVRELEPVEKKKKKKKDSESSSKKKSSKKLRKPYEKIFNNLLW